MGGLGGEAPQKNFRDFRGLFVDFLSQKCRLGEGQNYKKSRGGGRISNFLIFSYFSNLKKIEGGGSWKIFS